MAIADFQELCKGICEVAGMQPPALAPSEQGTWSATVHMRDVEITVLQFGARAPGTAFLIAEFGELPEDRALAGWLALMNANLHMAGENAPAYSRNPDTGKVLLHWACPYWSVTVVDVYQRIVAMVDLACKWREDYFLHDTTAGYTWTLRVSGPHTPATDESRSGRERFDALHLGICRELDMIEPRTQVDEITHGFALQVKGLNVLITHSLENNPDAAVVVIRLDRSSSDSELDVITELMDANFVLMSVPQGARFSRERISGELLLQYAYLLVDASADDLLSHLDGLAELALEWRESLGRANAEAGAPTAY
jgi:hypothetical protein